jgi:hypothetical protein
VPSGLPSAIFRALDKGGLCRVKNNNTRQKKNNNQRSRFVAVYILYKVSNYDDDGRFQNDTDTDITIEAEYANSWQITTTTRRLVMASLPLRMCYMADT